MPFHPVTADDINAKLRAIESEHQVHVLLACESGSRSFGFESPESDYLNFPEKLHSSAMRPAGRS